MSCRFIDGLYEFFEDLTVKWFEQKKEIMLYEKVWFVKISKKKPNTCREEGSRKI